MHSCARCVLAAVLVVGLPAAGAAQGCADVVTLANGDRIAGGEVALRMQEVTSMTLIGRPPAAAADRHDVGVVASVGSTY